MKKIVLFSMDRPKPVIISSLALTLLFLVQFPKIKIDTDPENMLGRSERIRVFHETVKERFGINDLIVVGVINEAGVFTADTLNRIERISNEIVKIKGVKEDDFIAPSFSDDVRAGGGTLEIGRFMEGAVETDREAGEIGAAMLDNPLYADKLASRDGKGIALYVPIEKKDQAHRISGEIEKIIKKHKGGERYYIAGLPVAEDTFGYEMFLQMGISAPLAGMVVFLMMLFFFRRLKLVFSPMIVAMISIVWTMGLLIGGGFTVHIMSSMIPIFLMPIAVCDSVHILSEYHDKYPLTSDKRKTLIAVMDELFTPMLFTSLTSAAGFASLALVPIPPVRVFGLFVAFGIMAAWILTITFVPAYVMLTKQTEKPDEPAKTAPERNNHAALKSFGGFAFDKGRIIFAVSILVFLAAVYGVSRIKINDNPVRWFKKSHKIRVADSVMNEHFGGTYMAYLVFEGDKKDAVKRPEAIAYVEALQRRLESLDVVGKTSSVADIVKRVNYVVHDENPEFDVLPRTGEEIGQYLFLFLMSGDPGDLDNFVDYDYELANIWVQLKSGDNEDMESVAAAVKDFEKETPPPAGFTTGWAGLTYLNVVWQKKMVGGMGKSLVGAYVIVFILMVVLFRSFFWGILSVVPLTLTIAVSYGFIGIIGKDYDMPVAVLSSLSLGLSIDFAIHFVQRFRAVLSETRDAGAAVERVFGSPATAILRNAAVISVGFLPLLIAPLTPYVTVGAFLAAIMLLSAASTLMILPALIRSFQKLAAREGE
ncbi:MAG: MMPL family transporter [bacterium]